MFSRQSNENKLFMIYSITIIIYFLGIINWNDITNIKGLVITKQI